MEGFGLWKKFQAHAISCLAAFKARKEQQIKKCFDKTIHKFAYSNNRKTMQ